MRLNTKEWILYGSAVTLMISGVILTFLSFFILGLVENGTLIYVAQALVFAGAVYGVNVYYGTKFGDYESRTNYNIEETIKKYIHKYINEDLKNSKKDKLKEN